MKKMSIQQAINVMEKYTDIALSKTVIQAHNMAIDALKRMIPEPVIKHKNPMEGCQDLNVCPNCKRIMVRTEIFGRTIDEHCVCCGKAIDWEE